MAFMGTNTAVDAGIYIGNSWMFLVNANGNATLAGTLTQNSDSRLKTNIEPINNSLELVSQLNGYHYQWKDEGRSQELQTGVLAQEVEAQMPELVSTDDKGVKSVNYSGLVPYLIESIKTLEKQNKALLEQNMEMQEQNKSMQQQINDIRKRKK
jgi:hypothetical protein